MLKSSAPRQSHVIKVMGGSQKIKTAASFVYDNIDALHDNLRTNDLHPGSIMI